MTPEEILVNAWNERVFLMASGYAIILTSIFFDCLYRKLKVREGVRNWKWVNAITSIKILDFRPLKEFDYFIGYLITLLIVDYFLFILLREFMEEILNKSSESFGWFIVILVYILIAYIVFLLGYHKKNNER
ncbi:hypothetical protein HYT57_05710 [Candidatus Woesearchaeota archaeon]|nr:hypothetical protein [Candidatus Woesearchaeota archaeon]